jgi:peptidoglycan lytic transglycosylase D
MPMRTRLLMLGWIAVIGAAQTPPPVPSPGPAGAQPTADDLFKLGKQLFDDYAPPEIKQQYEFPSKEQFDEFLARLQRALDNNDLTELAKYEPEARAALTALRALPGSEDYTDWLEQRLDEIEVARQLTSSSPPPSPPPISGTPPGPPPSAPRGPPPATGPVPYYDAWLARMRTRPAPAGAAALMPRLRAAFAAEGVPPELAWIAEAESWLNPSARSPAGAKGLFQLMPDTAHTLGLGTMLPDERSDPDKSARAAARYLRTLHGKFGGWPLALAAYNVGEGRVSRLLAARHATSFAGIASALPSETRMYVPKVCATVAARTGWDGLRK